LLFLLATDMVFARPSGIRSPTEPEEKEARRQRDISVFPLAFPLLAGPGALTSIVLSVGQARGFLETVGIIASLLVVLVLTLAALLSAGRLTKLLGLIGANVIARVLGVVLAALATQYVVDGITEIVKHLGVIDLLEVGDTKLPGMQYARIGAVCTERREEPQLSDAHV
jgi:multiple antibiotic resistance protein